MVTIVGYWAYGSSISDYMLGDLINGPKWAKVLANISVFLQTIVSQHVSSRPIPFSDHLSIEGGNLIYKHVHL